MCRTRGLHGELDLTEPPGHLAARVRALLKQCCRMCVPGHEPACERRTAVPFVIVCLRSGASWLKVSQMTPSVSCWTPNSSGIIARGCSVLASVFLSAATPIAESDVPAMKLAEAEKHMKRDVLVSHRTA